ncbi:MAG: hypothetical protein KatS3mg105_2142 [Gemmatales bacterium]|nr:MAG: hypothetical protein KatS3mg105_2142 [Gemmatales bacterium]
MQTGAKRCETGFQYHRARYYDPATGRWTSQDPLGLTADINPYRYAGNSPTNFVDRDGQIAQLVTGLIGAGIGAIVGGVVAATQEDATIGSVLLGAGLGAAAGGFVGLTLGAGAGVLGVTGGIVGASQGALESAATGGSAGEILFAGALGFGFGVLNPGGAFASAGGSLAFGSVAALAGGDFNDITRAALVGGLVGGIAQPFGGAAQTAFRQGIRNRAFLSALGRGAALAAPEVVGAASGAAIAS